MILQALVALAERKGLLDDPSFGKRPVQYQVRITDDGHPLGLTPLGDDKRGALLDVPTPPKRSGNPVPAFLVDNAQFVLGVPKQVKGKAPNLEQAAKSFAAFAEAVREATEATGDVGLVAVRALLDRVAASTDARDQVLAMAGDYEWTGNETIAFVRDADGTVYVHERPVVRAYWSGKRQTAAEAGTPQRCLVTGEFAPPARLHDVIKGIPEGQSSGTSVVSFNAPAFESQGFEQGTNAPVSQRAADGYVRALNHLLGREGERRVRSGIALGSDAVLVFWTRDESDAADLLLTLLSPSGETPDDIRAVFESAWKGLAPRDVDTTPFYAMTLGANASRVVVRDWLETTAADVKHNLQAWFADLALDGDDGSPLSLGRLLRSLEATPTGNDHHGVSAVLAARLTRAVVQGGPLPRELLHAALSRLRLPPRDGEWRGTLRARVGLIKATLLRRAPGERKDLSVSLDDSSVSVPYLLGRLFAALERLQASALGSDLNATIRDRYFGAASTTPALVFPRLLRLSMHHASKAESAGNGYAERVKAEIMGKLPAGAFPRSLLLEEQGLFAIGYYHQRQSFFTPRKSLGEAAVPAREELLDASQVQSTESQGNTP